MKPVSKHNFRNEFISIFNLDVGIEDEDIYPVNICKAHTDVFYRYRTAIKKNIGFSTSMEVTKFECHNDNNCIYCSETKHDETPCRKRYSRPEKWTPPGRGKRSKLFFEPIPANELPSNPLIDAFENTPLQDKERVLNDFINLGLSHRERLNILDVILKTENFSFTQDIEAIQTKYDNTAKLNDMEINKYLKELNPNIISLVKILSGCSLEEDSYRVAILLESLYKLRNANFVGPVSVLQNLTILSMTNSKTAVDIIGSAGAGGKYTTLCRWLSNIPANPLKCPPGDVLFVFDNEQIVGKTWNIKPQNKVKSSVITTVAVAQLKDEITYECNESLHPGRWFTHEKVTEILKDTIQSESEYNALKRVHMYQFKLFVTAAIEEILASQDETQKEKGDIIDQMVTKLQKERDYKTCGDCNIFVSKTKRKCPQCKKDLVRLTAAKEGDTNDQNESGESTLVLPLIPDKKEKSAEKEYIRYEHVKSGHPDEPIPVYVLDPVFVNPNSYDSLKLVLRHIGKIAGVKRYKGVEREWAMVCCDGLPYTMLFRLIYDYYTCSVCGQIFFGTDQIETHKKLHTEKPDMLFFREFDWVYIHSADGHYEMNLMKSFVNLNWDVCMKSMAYRMGWTSDAALKAAKHCYDNHKTWQLFLTFHFGTLMELLIPYIRTFPNEREDKPTANGFLKFICSMEGNPNYMYMFEMVSRYSQSVINLRMGIRRNNTILIQSAKFMSKELFHGRNHPRYQQIEMIESVQRKLCPNELANFIQLHESMSKTREKSKGQGYDFILEEVNKGIKSWIRKGIASDDMWLNVCRNFDVLNDLRSKICNILNLDKGEEYVRKLDLDDAINDWRVFLREKQYLTREGILHESTDGKPLHGTLINFTKEAKRKRDYRLLEFFLQQDLPDDFSLKHPVFVTPDEADHYQSFENQTLEVIDRIIMEMMEGFRDEHTRQTYHDYFKAKVFRKKKSVHLDFFNEVLEVLNGQALEHDNSDDNSSILE